MKAVITGAGGMLAGAVRDALDARGHEAVALDRAALDVTRPRDVESAILDARPHAVVQCAAYTDVDAAESDEDAATLVNAGAAGFVARACRRAGARFVYPSTDYVFDGAATTPYGTLAEPDPVNAYGRSKARGEVAARLAGDWLVVRTSWLYGAGGRNFVATILERARAGAALRVVTDQSGSPTWTRDLAAALVTLLERSASPGIYHVTNRGVASWHDLAVEAIRLAGLDADVEPAVSADFPRPALRPAYSVLDTADSERITGPLPRWTDALARALEEGV